MELQPLVLVSIFFYTCTEKNWGKKDLLSARNVLHSGMNCKKKKISTIVRLTVSMIIYFK